MANEIAVVLRVQDDGSVVLARAARQAKDTGDAMGRQLKPGVDQAEASLKNLGQSAGNLPGPLGAVARSVSSLTSFLSGPAGLALGAVAVAGAMVKLATDLGGAIERLDNLKVQTGLSVAALQTFEQIAKEAGEAPEGLVRSLGRVNEAIAEVLKGNTAAAKSFNAVGVDLVALVKSGASVEQVLEATARALVAIKDPTEQAARAQDLFGSRSAAVIAVLQRVGTEGLGPLMAEMRQAGIVTSAAANAMGRAFDALGDQVGRRLTALKNQAMDFSATMVLLAFDSITFYRRLIAGLLAPFTGDTEFMQGGAPNELMKWLDRIKKDAQAAATVTASGGPRDTAATADAADQAIKRLRADLDYLTASFRHGDIAAQEYVRRLGLLAFAARSLVPETLEQATALLNLKTQLRDTALAAEEVKGLGHVLQDLGDDLSQLDTLLAAGFAERWRKQMEALPAEIDTVVSRLELFRAAAVISPAQFEQGLARLIAGLEATTGKSDAVSDALLRLKIRLSEVQAGSKKASDEADALQDSMDQLAARGFVGAGDQIRQAARELTDFERDMQRLIRTFDESRTGAFREFFRDIIGGTRSLKDAFRDLGQKLQASVAEFLSSAIVREFQQFFAVTPGESAAVLTGAHGLLAEFAAEFSQEGATLVSAFQNLSFASLQTAQAFAAAAGTAAGSAVASGVFGPGAGQSTGSAVGGVAGGIVGGYFFGPGGAAAGAFVGSFIGGAIGSLFDSTDFDAYGKKMEQTITQAFGQGILEAIKSGDVDGAFADVEARMKDAILMAVIDAFVQSAVIRRAVEPLVEALNDALQKGLGPGQLAETMGPAIEAFRQKMAGLRPLFGEIVDVIQDLIIPSLNDSEQATDGVRRAAEDVNKSFTVTSELLAGPDGVEEHFGEMNTALEETHGIVGTIGAALTELRDKTVTVTVHTVNTTSGPTPSSPGSDGRQHGGWIPGATLGRDHVMAALDGGEFVVNARAARRFRPLLELINAGGTTRAGAMGFQTGGEVPRAAGFPAVTQGAIDFVQGWLDGLRQLAVELALLARNAEALRAASAIARGSIQIFDVQIGALRQSLATAATEDEALQGAQALQAAIMGRYEMERALVQQEFAFQRNEIQKTSDLRFRALDKERQALQAQLQTTQEWARVVESVRAQAFQLFQQFGPTNPSAQFGEAFGRFSDALTAFRADPTAAGADEVQRFAQAALQAAQGVYTRPSPAFQDLFRSITAALDEVAAIATEQAGATSLADLQAALTTVDETIRAEQESLRTTLEALDAEQAAREIPILTAQGVALATIHTDLVALLGMLGVGGGGARGGTPADPIASLRQAFTVGLQASGADQQRMLAAFTAAGLTAPTGDLVTSFLAGKDLVDAATATRYLQALVSAGLIPSFQAGGVMPRTGLAMVHTGERVIPASGAAPVIHITINGARDPARTAKLVGDEVARVLRQPGPAREAVKAIR